MCRVLLGLVLDKIAYLIYKHILITAQIMTEKESDKFRLGPLPKIEDVNPVLIQNIAIFCEIRDDLRWLLTREENENPEYAKNINRQLAMILLQLTSSDSIRSVLNLNGSEADSVHMGVITQEVSIKLRVFVENYLRDTIGM